MTVECEGGGAKVVIRLTAGAEADLHNIWRRRLAQGGAEGNDGADALLEALVARVESLGDHPERGPVPPELAALGIHTCRQLSHPPFQIIYRVDLGEGGALATVAVIADARRDFRTLLEERMLGGR